MHAWPCSNGSFRTRMMESLGFLLLFASMIEPHDSRLKLVLAKEWTIKPRTMLHSCSLTIIYAHMETKLACSFIRSEQLKQIHPAVELRINRWIQNFQKKMRVLGCNSYITGFRNYSKKNRRNPVRFPATLW